MKYKTILLFLGMHMILCITGTAISQTALIPGETAKLKISGLIILALYAAGTLYTAMQCERKERIFLEIWKICLLGVFALTRFTNGTHGALAAIVMISPFRPLILVSLKKAFLYTAGMLLAETAMEAFLFTRSPDQPA